MPIACSVKPMTPQEDSHCYQGNPIEGYQTYSMPAWRTSGTEYARD